MRKLPARKLLGALIAGALFVPNQGFTLGLGEIEVNSALNQKLSADIELLSAAVEDAENIIVKLASRKEFTRAGIDRPYLLNDLRFKSEVINGVPHIKVSSGNPIREPFLNFLVEVEWPNGHLLREYTVLLDPPVFMTQPVSAASVPASDHSGFRPDSGGTTSNIVPVVAPVAPAFSSNYASSRPATVATAPANAVNVQPSWAPAPVLQQQTMTNQPVGSYRIKAGDTAWSLADAMRPDKSISVEQMMIAMLRSNPESFINENVNGLKRGYILRMPDYDQIATINQADARALVREQAALWRQYQQSQAANKPVSAMKKDDMASSADAGEGDAADASAATDEDSAYLEIVSAGSGTSGLSGKDPTKMTAQELRAELALSRERIETERVEKEALQNRVDTLEQHVDTMKGMLSIEDKELSEVQSLNQPAEGGLAAAEPTDGEIPEQAVLTEEAATEPGDEVSTETEPEGADSIEGVATEAVEGDVTEATEEDSSQAAVFIDETAAAQDDEKAIDESMAEMPEHSQAATGDIVTPQSQIDNRAPADPLTQLLNDPMMLAAAGGGLLLFAALIGIIIKRRKASAEETVMPVMDTGSDDLESLADEVANEAVDVEEEVKVESLAGDSEAALEKDFDSTSTKIVDSADEVVVEEAESDVEIAEEDESRDDIIAEADVYLAYGIYQQAEELLTKAIADNPDRDDYRVKLAETHYASKNADAFVEVASEIKQRVDEDSSPDWNKVMVMGQDLCADNPMFHSSMVADHDADSVAPNAPVMDFDLGINEPESGHVTPGMDLTLGDEELELPEMDEEAGSSDTIGENADETSEAADLDENAAQVLEAEEDAISAKPMDELEFDLSDTGAVETIADEEEFSLDIDASELDIDVQDEAEDVSNIEEVADIEDVTDISEENMDLENIADEDSSEDKVADVDDVDVDFGLEENVEYAAETETETETPVVEEEVAYDLSDEAALLKMDIGEEADEAGEMDISLEASDELSDEDDFDLSSLDDVDEVSTKLDLARAYFDMGDHDGTRVILEEVIADGTDEQKQEARDLMAKLD